jgi:hypothetical protein
MEDLTILLIFCRRFDRRLLLCYHTSNLLSTLFLLVFRGNLYLSFLSVFLSRYRGRNFILSCLSTRVNWKFKASVFLCCFILLSVFLSRFRGRNLILPCPTARVNWKSKAFVCFPVTFATGILSYHVLHAKSIDRFWIIFII